MVSCWKRARPASSRRIALNDAETNALASVCDNSVKTSRFPCANQPYAHEFQGMESMRLPQSTLFGV